MEAPETPDVLATEIARLYRRLGLESEEARAEYSPQTNNRQTTELALRAVVTLGAHSDLTHE